jgi:hypothetical protein
MSNITLSTFISGKRTYRFNIPLVLEPQYDKADELWHIKYPPLSIDVASATRSELERELVSELDFLWQTFAQDSPKSMTMGARKLRQTLLNRISAA